jgi:hypothetical protein
VRAAGRLQAAAGYAERTNRGLPGGAATTRSTRLLQPWHCARLGLPPRVIVTSAKRSCASRCADRGSSSHGASRSCGSRALDADAPGDNRFDADGGLASLAASCQTVARRNSRGGVTRLQRSLIAPALLTKHVSHVEIRLPVVLGREPSSPVARNAIR